MATLNADRRLYITADRSMVVEEGDTRGAFLLAGIDGQIGEGDVQRFHMTKVGGAVRFPGDKFGTKMATAHEDKMVARAEDKAAPGEDEGDEGEPDEGWTLKCTPAEYLKRTPDGPKADLARRLLSGEDE